VLGGGRGIIEAGFNSSYKNLSIDLSSKYSDGNAGNSISGLLKFSYKIGPCGRKEDRVQKGKSNEDKYKEHELKKVVYYGFEEFELSQDAKNTLNENVQYLINNPDVKVILEGHADERGTRKYNMELGKKRAQKVKEYYESKGVEGSRMKIESYGEDKLEETGSSEQAHSKNRRVVTRVVATK
jgi:peptidoglycan-associated lipoprotein